MAAKIGILLTIAFFGFWAALVYSRFYDFAALSLNELGDFLSGTVGSAALLWIVLGYFQQGKELKNSAHALHLQANELKNSVQQQTALVAAAKEQLQIEKESRERQARLMASQDLPFFKPDLPLDRYDTTNNGYNLLLSFVNTGKLARVVYVCLINGEGKILHEECQNIESEKSFHSYLQVNEKLLLDGWSHIIRITSVSVLNMPSIQEFALTGNQLPIPQASYPPLT